ncbi:hypothetical protein BDK51DRAFT_21214 [Blyttiomyces helicus]|uniref:GrpE protein homolog n=1 Tax=Blyttiomyces helicus TaxID=388810 RepID=A0A4P9WG40_9FUNG|nr:hypothetical protein BDK51DRAFT_21214 [Blyttiomyces helicus]|eukprot:RKO91302.1 hypothetical protein BDK51DRAFT_21214 [Blyttiomyces helicus]
MSSFKRALIPAIRSARPRPTTLQRLPVVASRPLALRKYSTEPVKPATETPEKPAENPADAATPNYTEVLAEKDKQIASLTDSYRRALAEAENVRARARKEVEDTKAFSIQKFAKDLLDTADILQMALKALPAEELEAGKNQHLTNLHQGVSMTRVEMLKSFKRYGVEEFHPLNEKFDPNLHQALFQAPIPGKEPGTVFEVVKVGYTIHGRCLRPAQVGVVQDTQ